MAMQLPRQRWILKPVHVSWRIAYISIGILVGAAVSPLVGDQFNNPQWIVIFCGLATVTLVKNQRFIIIIALLAGGIFGLYRASTIAAELAKYEPYFTLPVTVTGRVNEDTTYGSKGDQRMRVDQVVVNGMQLPASIWVSSNQKLDIKRGDYVTVSGTLLEGFGSTPASIFRADIVEIQRPVLGDVGRVTRDWFGDGVRRAMSESDANFALAFLLGQKLELPNDLGNQLKTIGLIHAIVASGYHLTVLIGFVRRLFVGISKYLTLLFSSALIGSFILITGFSPSMTRAGLVSGIALLTWYYGRKVHPIVLLSFAAALTVVYNPQYVWGDIGWYLSFTSFAGVILLAPLLQHYFWGDRPSNFLREIMIVTLAAQLATMPISIAVFGYYSAYALIANLLVVPLIPLIMALTFISGVVGLVLPVIAPNVGFLVSVLLRYVVYVVQYIAGLPSAKTEVTLGPVFVGTSYVILCIVTYYLWRKTHHNFRSNSDNNRIF